MHDTKRSRRGFTLFELLVTLGIFVVIATVVLINISGKRSQNDLTDVTQQIGAALREAQSDAMSQESSSVWGVRFSNATSTSPFYALFISSYASSNIMGYYRLPADVSYVTSTLASGATLDVIFSQASGAPSFSGNLRLYMPQQSTNFSSTISIAPSGEISY